MKKEAKHDRDKINYIHDHIKMLRKSHPAVKKCLNLIFEKPIIKVGAKVELKNTFI